MSSMCASSYLESYLSPLGSWLDRQDVTDIYVNRPGEVWVETLGNAPERFETPELTAETLARLARQIAAASTQGISRSHPLLAASLPTGERVQIAIPPATRGHIAVAIRKHISAGLALEDYRGSGAFSATTMVGESEFSSRQMAFIRQGDPIELLRQAVLKRRNILVSGGTSSGKTTFLNALLREIPSNERILVIEDTPEIQIDHQNAVGLIAARGVTGEAQVTAEDLLIASLRMRPDRIILGEIRGAEANTFLRAVNTGHPGSLSTIHADTPERAIDQLALLVMQTGTRMAWSDVVAYVKKSLDVVVQLRRVAGKREIAEMMVRE